MVENFPFDENIKESSENCDIFIRNFKSNLNNEELKWHWDEEDRIISPCGETNWKFQFDNELPINIDSKIKVPKGTWHRLIKGDGDLTLIIEKSIY